MFCFILCSSQRVGASKYGVRPRFVRPPEKPRTDLQRLMMKAGAVATANVISSRFSSEGKLDRGGCSGGETKKADALVIAFLHCDLGS